MGTSIRGIRALQQAMKATNSQARSFHTSSPRQDAFAYMHQFEHIMPQEHKLFIETHKEFSTVANNICMEHLGRATSLQQIRTIYKNETLHRELASAATEHAKETGVDPTVLSVVARNIAKWEARDVMSRLGFNIDLGNIHADNEKKYGNAIGPTPTYLSEKYDGDLAKMKAATTRFRSDADMQRDFKKPAEEAEAPNPLKPS